MTLSICIEFNSTYAHIQMTWYMVKISIKNKMLTAALILLMMVSPISGMVKKRNKSLITSDCDNDIIDQVKFLTGGILM